MFQVSPVQPSEDLMWVLHSLLVIGMLINFVKGAELILRPHQQKWLQDKCDTLALRLDYTSPLKWYMESGVIQKWFWLLYELVIICAFVVYVFSNRSLNIYNLAALVCFILSIVLLGREKSKFILVSGLWKRLITEVTGKERDPMAWMLEGRTISESIYKQLVVSGFGLICCYLFYLFLTEWILHVFQLGLYLILMTIYGLVITPLAIIGLANILVMLVSVLIFVTELMLVFIRGIVWRIAEYYKGAFAAILLLITGALGMAEVYFRFLKK